MCTLVLHRRPGHAEWPLLLAANRDEMRGRPSRPPGRHWPDRPDVVAGLDELGGGSWLGINDDGVVAAILNRVGTLGPAAGRRSRGELVLEALDHADAAEAAAALAALDPAAYRPFNLVVADDRDAFWLRNADPTGTLGIDVVPIPPGLAMIDAHDLDDERNSPRQRRYRPRFAAAPLPDPEAGDWAAWEALLASGEPEPGGEPRGGMQFATPSGFATVSSALVALPPHGLGRPPRLRHRDLWPAVEPWRDVPI